MKRAKSARIFGHLLLALLVTLGFQPAARAAEPAPKYCKRAEKRARGLLNTFQSAQKKVKSLELTRAALLRSMRKKESKLQSSVAAQSRALEENGKKYADSLKYDWDGNFRQRAIGLTVAVPPLPAPGAHDSAWPALLTVPFTLNLEGPGSRDAVFASFLQNYFDYKYPEGAPTDPIELAEMEQLKSRMIDGVIEKITKMRTAARNLLIKRVESAQCKPLEEGGNDCGSSTALKAARLRKALAQDEFEANNAQALFERHVADILYRPCKGAILKVTKGACWTGKVQVDLTPGAARLPIVEFPVTPGGLYIVTAKGTYNCGDEIPSVFPFDFEADAGYVAAYGVWGPSWNPLADENDCELFVNGGPVDWGKMDLATHKYEIKIVAGGPTLGFQLYDSADGGLNNSGGLDIEVCVGITPMS